MRKRERDGHTTTDGLAPRVPVRFSLSVSSRQLHKSVLSSEPRYMCYTITFVTINSILYYNIRLVKSSRISAQFSCSALEFFLIYDNYITLPLYTCRYYTIGTLIGRVRFRVCYV